ncbi:hypothetical protein KJ628_04690 [Patescibacteria group bacterium]|nr:hypothetical protein [Patescibacteria group bacterium]
MILLITGSPASGKTTIANILSNKHKFQQIDGDEVIKDLGLKSKAWNTIHHELISRALSQHAVDNVVVSHVVPLEKMNLYQTELLKSKIELKVIVLQPTKEALLERNQVRTCHPKPTPIEVIDYFYEKFQAYQNTSSDCLIIDTSNQAQEETIKEILFWL